MLVLLGPSFVGGDADYQRLSKVTGMVENVRNAITTALTRRRE